MADGLAISFDDGKTAIYSPELLKRVFERFRAPPVTSTSAKRGHRVPPVES
jgi:hypothetical protein